MSAALGTHASSVLGLRPQSVSRRPSTLEACVPRRGWAVTFSFQFQDEDACSKL